MLELEVDACDGDYGEANVQVYWMSLLTVRCFRDVKSVVSVWNVMSTGNSRFDGFHFQVDFLDPKHSMNMYRLIVV